MAKSSPATRPSARKAVLAAQPGGDAWRRLTDAGLTLAAAIAAARMLMDESFKQTMENPLPGVAGAPLGPGPATGLVIDLLCWLPAFAVLLRLLLDSRYTLRQCGASIVMGFLGLWAVASMAWSADQFTAIVSAFHLFSAMVLLWSAVQLVRSWYHLRLVAGLCAALLAALAVKGYSDHFFEQPMVRANWNAEKADVMRENHWTEDSPDYKLFQGRVLSEEAIGFSQSPNTYAGLLVLLGTITAGTLLERPGKMGRWIGVLAVIAICAPLLKWTQCRAAVATPILSAGTLGLCVWKRRWLAERAAAGFIAGTAAIACGFAAVAGYGLARGNLIHSSLTFRWWYWTGAARIIRAHLLRGVGWGNFGKYYLAVRLPIASEEIIDPHNYIVRFFADLGVIGGILLLAWLAWTAWELTAGAASGWKAFADESAPRRDGWLIAILAAPIAAIVINFFASVDFTQSGDFLLLESVNRIFWLSALGAGMAVALVRRRPGGRGEIVLERQTAPMPIAAMAMLVGLGVFLIHNLIEFGIFEPGPMMLVALLTGASLGIRSKANAPGARIRRAVALALACTAAGWLAAAILLVAPVVAAEYAAETGDDLIRAKHPAEAQEELESAAKWVPYNALYFVRAASAGLRRQPPDVDGAMRLLQSAIVHDPLSLDAYLLRARLELLPPASPASIDAALSDYRQALAIDPNNLRLHLELANNLARWGQNTAAVSEYQTVWQLDEALERGDPKRLSAQEIEPVLRAIRPAPPSQSR